MFQITIYYLLFSEKTWKALQNLAVPVVFGTSLVNAAKLLPPNSFLHVDNFTTTSALAEWIKYLDENKYAYRYLACQKHDSLHSPSKETQHGKLHFFLGRV